MNLSLNRMSSCEACAGGNSKGDASQVTYAYDVSTAPTTRSRPRGAYVA